LRAWGAGPLRQSAAIARSRSRPNSTSASIASDAFQDGTLGEFRADHLQTHRQQVTARTHLPRIHAGPLAAAIT
jgi:hypothetical protein